jgi:hypothetical protein
LRTHQWEATARLDVDRWERSQERSVVRNGSPPRSDYCSIPTICTPVGKSGQELDLFEWLNIP